MAVHFSKGINNDAVDLTACFNATPFTAEVARSMLGSHNVLH
jgi:hypothetical protein